MVDVTYEDYQDLVRKLSLANERIRDLEKHVSGQDAFIAALEAQLAARTGAVKPLDEDDYEEIISAAAINMRKAASGIRGQVITVQDSIDWWVMKETERRILSALEPAATCNESLQVEPAAPEGQPPVADALELSGNTGELVDRVAAAIRDWGSHYDDGPWESLSDERKEGWRSDARRALAVVKEYLTARRPAEQAVTEAMVARASAEYQEIFGRYLLSSHARRILKAAMEAGR